jgi:predicted nuclease of predicted toxin-antitoxin system
MWLLDKNVPIQLSDALNERGISAVTAEAKDWGALTNGDLIAVAVAAGISCILTRDRLFAQSASKAFKVHTALAVVILVLPQLRAQPFLDAFSWAWAEQAIDPRPGESIFWPAASIRQPTT